MQQSNNAMTIVFILGIVGLIIFKISDILNLDFETSATVLRYLIVWGIFTGGAVYFSRSWYVLPFSAVIFFWCLIPALNYWSSSNFPFHTDEVMWYATLWFKILTTVIIALVFFGIATKLKEI